MMIVATIQTKRSAVANAIIKLGELCFCTSFLCIRFNCGKRMETGIRNDLKVDSHSPMILCVHVSWKWLSTDRSSMKGTGSWRSTAVFHIQRYVCQEQWLYWRPSSLFAVLSSIADRLLSGWRRQTLIPWTPCLTVDHQSGFRIQSNHTRHASGGHFVSQTTPVGPHLFQQATRCNSS